MFQWVKVFILSIATLCLYAGMAGAWEQHVLPHTSVTSMTPHYGGSKAPLVRGGVNIMTAAVSDQGAEVWWSADDGESWQADALYAPGADHVVALSDQLVLSWGLHVAPRIHENPTASFGGWRSQAQAWPLASWNILDAAASASGEVVVLATVPDTGRLVEGKLYVIRGSAAGWYEPVSLSQASVGDAALVRHPSGLWTAVWSERAGASWKVMLANSGDAQVWSNPMEVVAPIAAPQAQEAAVQIAADALPNEAIALAFTGWGSAPHSQVWSMSWDVNAGVALSPKTLLPDAGDMVYQPSLVVLGASRWAVAWQQKKALDHEIMLAQHQADGSWSKAVNVSSDSSHVDRDPHLSLGASDELMVAFTRRVIPDIQEVYTVSEGSVLDLPSDSDGDGMPDSQESGIDMNQDGLDDAFSASVATWQAEDGRYSISVLGQQALVDTQAMLFAHTNLPEPASYTVTGQVYAFRVLHVPESGSVQVHIALPVPLAAEAIWMQWHHGLWSAYDGVIIDADAMGITLEVTDGGLGDVDGLVDGQVLVSGAVVLANTTDTAGVFAEAPVTAGGGGCAIASQSQFDPLLPLVLLLSLLAGRWQHVLQGMGAKHQ